MRLLGTVARGLRAPIFNQGDDIAQIATDVILQCQQEGVFEIQDRDIFALTESVVARTQGNYASVDDITEDLIRLLGGKVPTLGLALPIMSRNRFAMLLEGMAGAADEVIVQFGYPSDEVGNHLIEPEVLEEAGVDPYHDVFTEEEWVSRFGKIRHTFTGVDYVSLYREIVEATGARYRAVFANDVRTILKDTDVVINCDIHTRYRSQRRLQKAGCKTVMMLDNILTKPVNGSGYNADYGLLGSNKADNRRVKLFPRDCTEVSMQIQKLVLEATGKRIEVMVYGDGAFKDPVGKIWELADPVVSPGFTPGLEGRPSELKLKYLADNEFAWMDANQQSEAIRKSIREKDSDLTGAMAAEGTTPRRITDLLGSLSDLVSGSGDKGTPFVYIQGYFDNYADD